MLGSFAIHSTLGPLERRPPLPWVIQNCTWLVSLRLDPRQREFSAPDENGKVPTLTRMANSVIERTAQRRRADSDSDSDSDADLLFRLLSESGSLSVSVSFLDCRSALAFDGRFW